MNKKIPATHHDTPKSNGTARLARTTPKGRLGLTVAALSLLLAPTPIGGAGPVDPADATQIFSSYELVSVDPSKVWNQLASGRAVLDLGALGRHRVEVDPAPWPIHNEYQCLDCETEGGQTMPTEPRAAYIGQVAGMSASRALVSVSATRLYGFVEEGATAVWFEPAQRLIADAPAGTLLVYRGVDLLGNLVDHHDILAEGVGTVPIPPSPSPSGAESAGSTGNRFLRVAVDSATWNAGRIWDVYAAMDAVNAAYYDQFGFYLDAGVHACGSLACDSQYGLSAADSNSLLTQSSAAWSQNLQNWGEDALHAISGKGQSFANCGDGRGYQPGRYSAQVIKWSQCSYATFSVTMGHEVGHNFAGGHAGAAPTVSCPNWGQSGPTGVWGRARCWAVWQSRYVYVCPAPYDVIYQQTGSCPSGGHYEDQGNYYPQRSLMWGGGIDNWGLTASSDNAFKIIYCEGYGHSGGTYVPGSIVGFGSSCIG